MESNLRTRDTQVCGKPIVVFSLDGWRWFSDKREAEHCEQRRQKFLSERAQS
jgi:hypothetical protein